MKKSMVLLACLVCTAILASCAVGSGSPDTGSTENQSVQTHLVTVVDAHGNPIEPGQLISKEEAAQLLGQNVQDMQKSENPEAGQELVQYNGTNAFIHAYLEIVISQQIPEGMSQTAGEQADTAAGTDQLVEGIPSKYIFHTPGLHILSYGYYLVIDSGNFHDTIVHQRLIQAGTLAVNNLKNLLGK
jgi:hypothetical protein